MVTYENASIFRKMSEVEMTPEVISKAHEVMPTAPEPITSTNQTDPCENTNTEISMNSIDLVLDKPVEINHNKVESSSSGENDNEAFNRNSLETDACLEVGHVNQKTSEPEVVTIPEDGEDLEDGEIDDDDVEEAHDLQPLPEKDKEKVLIMYFILHNQHYLNIEKCVLFQVIQEVRFFFRVLDNPLKKAVLIIQAFLSALIVVLAKVLY